MLLELLSCRLELLWIFEIVAKLAEPQLIVLCKTFLLALVNDERSEPINHL